MQISLESQTEKTRVYRIRAVKPVYGEVILWIVSLTKSGNS